MSDADSFAVVVNVRIADVGVVVDVVVADVVEVVAVDVAHVVGVAGTVFAGDFEAVCYC